MWRSPTQEVSMLSRLALVLAVALLSSAAFSQRTADDDHVLARLAYRNSLADSMQNSQVCMAVYADGFYRLIRGANLSIAGSTPEIPGRMIVQGTLSRGQLARLKAMTREVNQEKSHGGGVVLEGAEVFTAELSGDGRGSSLTWVDADHENPFPAAVSGLVKWLLDFKAVNSSSITLHELSDVAVCPRAGPKPVVPTVAELEKGSK
jgi:hypothetical protein